MIAIQAKPEILRLQCSWCKAILRQGSDPASKVVSHGLCQSCCAVHFPERSQTVKAAAK